MYANESCLKSWVVVVLVVAAALQPAVEAVCTKAKMTVEKSLLQPPPPHFLTYGVKQQGYQCLAFLYQKSFGRDYIASIASTASKASIEVKRDVIVIDAL